MQTQADGDRHRQAREVGLPRGQDDEEDEVLKKVLPYKQLPPVVCSLLQDRVYLELPVSKLAAKHGMTPDKVREVLESPAHREYVIHLRREKQFVVRGRYNRLERASYRAIKEILKTDHITDVIDERSGTVVGKKVDANIMKIKEKVASDVLENVGAKRRAGKGPMFQINNLNGRARDDRILEENRKREIENLLNSCKVVEVEKS